MNLSGNKIVAASALFLAVNLANAAAPDLVEFTSGTAAKAAEVNSNFDELKTYSAGLEDVIEAQAALITALENKTTAAEADRTALEGKVTVLETESADLQSQITTFEDTLSSGIDEYTIPVKGDGIAIGNTNRIPTLNDSTILIKTEFGLAIIDQNDGQYVLKGYNEAKSELAENQILFTDDQCENAHVLTSGGEYGNSFTFTKDESPANGDLIVTSAGHNISYLLRDTAEINTTTVNFYKKSWEGVCGEPYTAPAGVISFPVEMLTEEGNGLKSSYTTITVSDFVTH